jgi:hypothetical protein
MIKPFCECCGETNPSLLTNDLKSKKHFCRNCKDTNCPAYDEHKKVKFYRIGHFVFTNAVGMQQSIAVRSSRDKKKVLALEVN